MKDHTAERIEKVLNSTDGMLPVEAPAFFYTRLSAKMNKQHDEDSTLVRRPALAIAALSFFVLMNIFLLIKYNQQQSVNPAQHSTLDSFVSNYNLDNNWGN